MRNLKYFVQFILILFFFFIFKLIGVNLSSFLSGKIFEILGPFFRSKSITNKNIRRAFPKIKFKELEKISNSMWNNYGRVFAEYMFIKNFRHGKLRNNISITGVEILEKIKSKNQKVIFISGHFSNFELMAMQLDKFGIKISAIYRPLNNIFLNPIMEKIRKTYVCKKQIKKGMGGIRELISLINNDYSTALMIDQRVSQGIKSKFFDEDAFTTTIPAQIAKKYGLPVVPIFIERYSGIKFNMKIQNPIYFQSNKSINDITRELNQVIEEMIIRNPKEWIWTHNRWK